jgi:hypothetical protein
VAYRFTGDRGASWVYCDAGGSSPSDPYSTSSEWRLTVGVDADGDSYYDSAHGGDDCDDASSAVHPGTTDPCGDGIDWNCDGLDPACSTTVDRCNVQYLTGSAIDIGGATTGYGRVYLAGVTDPAGQGPGIDAQLGYGPQGTDPSADPTTFTWVDAAYNMDYTPFDEYMTTFVPAAGVWDVAYRFSADGEVTWTYCDSGGSGPGDSYIPASALRLTVGTDADADGSYDADHGGDDCDDTDASVYPGAPEIAGDGIDQDCDGVDLVSTSDLDGDGHDSLADGGDDCDDGAASVYPGASELDDDLDNDCDDIVDEGFRVAGDLVITEIMYNPSGTEPNTEWFEIFNPSATRDLYLDGLLVYSSSSSGKSFYVAPASLVVPAGGYVVLCWGDSTLGASCDYVYGTDVNDPSDQGATYNGSFSLGNSSGPITVRLSLGGTTLDEVAYSFSSGWPSSSNGKAIGVDPTAMDSVSNDTGSNWCYQTSTYSGTDTGTPGAVNDACF